MTNHRSHLVGAALISTLCSTHAFVVRDAPMTKSAPSPGPALLNKIKDTTKIGDLVVPNVGIGTIAWSPKESTLDDLELHALHVDLHQRYLRPTLPRLRLNALQLI